MKMSRRKCFLKYTGLFLVVFFFGFMAFWVQGKSFIWKSDGYRQYYPVLYYLGKYYKEIVTNVFHGDFSLPMIDYTIGQGEDILTTFANYGLGDPLTLLAVFVPGKYTEYLYDLLVVLRLYLSGAAFLVYCEGMKLERKFSIYGALVYAFCGFAIWSVKDPFFLNAMIYLPLILLGIEKVLKRRGVLTLIFSVLFGITSGYYFFYMIVICALCYFVARSLMIYGKDIKRIVWSGIRCGAVSVAGVLLSAVLFLPSVYGYLESSRTKAYTSLSSLLFYDLSYYKNAFLRFISITENDDAAAVGYFSLAVIVLAAVCVLFGRKDKRAKALKKCVLICFVAVLSPFAGYLFNGFGYVTNRFMFIPSFLLSLVLVIVLPDILALREKGEKKLWIVSAVYVALCFFASIGGGWLQVLCMCIILAGTYVCIHFIGERKWLERAVLGLIVANLIVNCNLIYQKAGAGMADAYMEAGSGYSAYTSDKAVNVGSKLCNGLERLDVMFHNGENPNQSVVAGYEGISAYYSVISSGYSRYMMSLENAADLMFSHRMTGNDGRTVLENLANVQYVASKKEELVPFGFEKVQGQKYLYKNKNHTSIGYTYDRYVTEDEYDDAGVFERQNMLLQAAVVESGSGLSDHLSGLKHGILPSQEDVCASLLFEMTDVKHFDWVGGELEVSEKNGSFKISFPVKSGNEYYLRLDGLELEQAEKNNLWANVTMGQLSKSFLISDSSYDFYFGRKDYLICLGTVKTDKEEGEDRQLSFRINGPARYSLNNIELVEVPVTGISEKVETLNKESLQDVEVSGNCVTGELSVSDDKILCLALPYKKGYTLLVDGKETEISRVNKMYMGTHVKRGKHSIVLKYSTPGLVEGGILTIIGVAYTIFLWLFNKKHCIK